MEKYNIIGRYNVGKYEGGWEVIDTASNLKQAKFMLDEYIISFGNTWELSITKQQN